METWMWIRDVVIMPFIVSIIAGSIVVIIGIRSLKDFIRGREIEKEYGPLRKFWDTGSQCYNFVIICGHEKAADPDEKEPRFAYSEAFGMMHVTETLRALFGNRCTIKNAIIDRDDRLHKTCFEDNVIIFGSEYSVAKFRNLCLSFKVPYHQYDFDPKCRSLQLIKNGKIIDRLSSVIDDATGIVSYDVGSIVRIVNPINKRLVVMLNGNYAAGLYASILNVTSLRHFSKSCLGFNPEARAQQLVIGVSISDKMMKRDHPTDVFKQWTEFTVEDDDFEKAVQKGTSEANS